MAAKSGVKTRVCQNKHCKLGGKIMIETEPFIKEKNGCYHEACYQEKKDMMLLRDMWMKHISPTVVISQLNKVLGELIDLPGVTSGYLIFVMQYIIDNHCKLRYPQGFKYYVDKQDIKDAYAKKNRPLVTSKQFVITQDDDNAPAFTAALKKPVGFSSILGGKRT